MKALAMAAPLLGLALVVAACGSGGATSAPTTAATAAPASAAPASSAPASDAASASPSAAAGAVTVNLADTSLGSVLVDGAGKTLYIFTPDSGGKSVCNGDCATSWPPLAGGTPTLGTGLDAEDFTSITRDDGSSQLAFYGMPLYLFAGDAAAGDTKGQGLNDKWYVVGADGTPIK